MAENEYTIKHHNEGVPSQVILDAGLNVFALQLLVESYTDHPTPIPISFPYRGVNISLSLCEGENKQANAADRLPCCPTCGKPEDVEIDENGKVHIIRR